MVVVSAPDRSNRSQRSGPLANNAQTTGGLTARKIAAVLVGAMPAAKHQGKQVPVTRRGFAELDRHHCAMATGDPLLSGMTRRRVPLVMGPP